MPTHVQRDYDRRYVRRQSLPHWIVVRLFRHHINHLIKYVLCTAFERSIIGSYAFHELCGITDRILWPERH